MTDKLNVTISIDRDFDTDKIEFIRKLLDEQVKILKSGNFYVFNCVDREDISKIEHEFCKIDSFLVELKFSILSEKLLKQ